ncbi:MAG: amidohydrolase [Lachnospiraceae bacterium]|nr:amidohydrolase [Lachnospiraceae bacterium]
MVNGRPVYAIGDGKSNFGGEIRQMMPPYMNDDENTVERLIANMNYACVNGCVVTQEYIDGNQDDYLLESKAKYPDRIKICSLYEESPDFRLEGVDGVKICAGRLEDKDLKKLLPVFKEIEKAGRFLSIDLADGDEQVGDMEYLISQCPNLKIAIGHFGMVTTTGWQKQIALAKHKNVYIESGGLTWLFHNEFYPYPSAIDAILEAREICGIEKLMWGSDYPRTMTDITYIMAVRFIAESDNLTEAEKRAFLGENAMKFYGFADMKPMEATPNML